jgi:hypothetical protein
MSSCLYIYRSQLIVTSLRPNQSINRYFIFSRVRVNVALLLPQIPLPPLINLRRHGPCLPSFRCRLGGGWPYLHCRCVLPTKAKSAKTGPSGLRNRILQFFLKLWIVLQLDQAQTVWASQDVAHWSSSLKYSHVISSALKMSRAIFAAMSKIQHIIMKMKKTLLPRYMPYKLRMSI